MFLVFLALARLLPLDCVPCGVWVRFIYVCVYVCVFRALENAIIRLDQQKKRHRIVIYDWNKWWNASARSKKQRKKISFCRIPRKSSELILNGVENHTNWCAVLISSVINSSRHRLATVMSNRNFVFQNTTFFHSWTLFACRISCAHCFSLAKHRHLDRQLTFCGAERQISKRIDHRQFKFQNRIITLHVAIRTLFHSVRFDFVSDSFHRNNDR